MRPPPRALLYCFAAPALLGSPLAAAQIDRPTTTGIGKERRLVLERINPGGESYADHEIHPSLPEMVFQSEGEVWVGALDPDTGRFVSATGKDVFVDTISSLALSKNGPEYGVDAGGTSIFYNRTGPGSVLRIWRATPGPLGFERTPLTGLDTTRFNQLVSQDPTAASTFVVYARLDSSPPPGSIAWFDEATPAAENDVTPLVPGFAGFRWARGSTLLASTVAAGPDAGQVVLVDASTGSTSVVTNDAGTKFDPFPWFAPEFGGDLAIAAIVGGSDIAIYRDTGGAVFDRVAVLGIPRESTMTHAQSHEPFVADGISYLSLTLKDHPASIYTDVTEAQVSVYGIEHGQDRFTLRCDDGGPDRIRHEAETLPGNAEVFLYYNELLPSGRFDIVRCRTGLVP